MRTPDRPTEYYKSFSRWLSVETTAQIGRRRAGQGRGACLNRITVIVFIMLKCWQHRPAPTEIVALWIELSVDDSEQWPKDFTQRYILFLETLKDGVQ